MSAIDTIRALVEAKKPDDAVTLVRYGLLRELLTDIRKFTEQRYNKLERAVQERDVAQERSLNRMMEIGVMKEKIEKLEAENARLLEHADTALETLAETAALQTRLDEIVPAAQDLWRWAKQRGPGQETSREKWYFMMGRLAEALDLVE